MKTVIQTDQAPAAIGCYSQAIKANNTVYLSGQIPLDPKTMTLVSSDIESQVVQVFENLQSVCKAANGNLNQIVRLTVYLRDINHSTVVNDVMKRLFKQPYPARTTFAVVALPKEALVEIDGILVL